MEAFCNASIAAEEVKSIQYRGSNRSWCVSFVSRPTKDHIFERGVVHFGNTAVFIGDADFKTVIVKIIGRLSHYRRVLSFHRDVGVATGILNYVHTARMRLSLAIPDEVVFISYPGQPKPCQRCGEEGQSPRIEITRLTPLKEVR